VVGTSYGGFVAYALARAAGPGRVGPVVISNSDLLKTAEDDRALLQRAGGDLASTADLLMPLDARTARRLMELTFYRRQLTAMLPDFLIGEIVQVTDQPIAPYTLVDQDLFLVAYAFPTRTTTLPPNQIH
jgi:pimeloyl-ACP methyl ester carboxylesterase